MRRSSLGVIVLTVAAGCGADPTGPAGETPVIAITRYGTLRLFAAEACPTSVSQSLGPFRQFEFRGLITQRSDGTLEFGLLHPERKADLLNAGNLKASLTRTAASWRGAIVGGGMTNRGGLSGSVAGDPTLRLFPGAPGPPAVLEGTGEVEESLGGTLRGEIGFAIYASSASGSCFSEQHRWALAWD